MISANKSIFTANNNILSMKNDMITVGIADMKIACPPKILITYALGSCVGVCLLDKTKSIGGMLHVMLPNINSSAKAEVFKFADSGIPEMIKQMEQKGCMRSRMVAKIAGGAKLFDIKSESNTANIGDRNTEAVKKCLEAFKIRIIAHDTGANYGRTIMFDSSNGELFIKTYSRASKVI